MNDGLIDHVCLLARFVLNHVSRLSDVHQRFDVVLKKLSAMERNVQSLFSLIPRLRGYIGDEVTKVRSELAEKFAMVVGKLNGLERRIESLEESGGGDSRTRNEVQELKAKVRDLTVECSRWRSRMDQMDTPNTHCKK